MSLRNRFRGRQTQFSVELLDGILFIAGFGYLVLRIDPRVAAFEGGLVVGYLLRVWEKMSISERILEEVVPREARQQVEAEVAAEVDARVAAEVAQQVGAEFEARLDEAVERRVTEDGERGGRAGRRREDAPGGGRPVRLIAAVSRRRGR
jgi:hypothetical protein